MLMAVEMYKAEGPESSRVKGPCALKQTKQALHL